MTDSTETPAAPSAPAYRYFTVPPAVVRLNAADLLPHLPRGAWAGASDRELIFSAAEVLETNSPRIRFTRLRELFPDCTATPAEAPEWITLPPAAVALAYQPGTRRELIVGATPPASEAPHAMDNPEKATTPAAKPAVPSWKRLRKPQLAPPAVPNAERPLTFEDRPVPAAREAHLREIFHTEGTFTIQRLAELLSVQSGVTGCEIRRGACAMKSGDLPAGLAGLAADALALHRSAGLDLVTLGSKADAVSFFRHEESTLLLAQRSPAVPPELREKILAALQAVEEAAR